MESRPFLTRVPDPDVVVTDRVPTSVPGTGRYHFAATRDSAGSVTSTSSQSQVYAGSQGRNAGTYAFDGHTLRLTETDGSQRAYTVAAFGKPDSQGRPEYLYLDGGMLARK